MTRLKSQQLGFDERSAEISKYAGKSIDSVSKLTMRERQKSIMA